MLFFSSTYVGDYYVSSRTKGGLQNAAPALLDEGARVGTSALFIQSIIGLVVSFVAPLLVESMIDAGYEAQSTQRRSGVVATLRRIHMNLTSAIDRIPKMTLEKMWIYSHFSYAFCMFSTLFVQDYVEAMAIIILVGPAW